MSNDETYHGNEEIIELASDELLPVVQEITGPKMATISTELMDRMLDAAKWRVRAKLGADWNMQDLSETEPAIASGLAYAHELNWFLISAEHEAQLKERGIN